MTNIKKRMNKSRPRENKPLVETIETFMKNFHRAPLGQEGIGTRQEDLLPG